MFSDKLWRTAAVKKNLTKLIENIILPKIKKRRKPISYMRVHERGNLLIIEYKTDIEKWVTVLLKFEYNLNFAKR